MTIAHTTTPTNITVRAKDGTTTETYTVATKAYDEADNPSGVYTAAQLYAVRGRLSDGYRLMQDVTLPNAGSGCTQPPSWTQSDYCTAGFSPIGTATPDSNQFTGTFDGNTHSIRKRFIGRGAVDNVGLFGYVGTSSEIRDLDVHIVATGAVNGRDKVGGLLGDSSGSVTNSYFPKGRPAGAGGTALDSGGGQGDFTGFTFQSDATTAGWKRIDGKWPQ